MISNLLLLNIEFRAPIVEDLLDGSFSMANESEYDIALYLRMISGKEVGEWLKECLGNPVSIGFDEWLVFVLLFEISVVRGEK